MTRAVVALAGVGIIVAVVLTLGEKGRLTRGGNGLTQQAFVQVVPAGGRFCQDERVPADAGILRMRIGSYRAPGSGLRIRFVRDGRLVTRGGLARGWEQGDVEIPIRPIAETVGSARMCVFNDGPPPLAFAGENGLVRTEWHTTERTSWFSRIGALRHRFAEGRATWYGSWSLVLVAALVLSAAAVAIVTVLRRPL